MNGLTREQEQKLERIKNYRTRYEAILTNGTQSYRVCYTDQHSRRGLVAAIRRNYADVLRITGEETPFVADAGDVFHGNEWRVLFSGRTQRECILSTELTWVGASSLSKVA